MKTFRHKFQYGGWVARSGFHRMLRQLTSVTLYDWLTQFCACGNSQWLMSQTGPCVEYLMLADNTTVAWLSDTLIWRNTIYSKFGNSCIGSGWEMHLPMMEMRLRLCLRSAVSLRQGDADRVVVHVQCRLTPADLDVDPEQTARPLAALSFTGCIGRGLVGELRWPCIRRMMSLVCLRCTFKPTSACTTLPRVTLLFVCTLWHFVVVYWPPGDVWDQPRQTDILKWTHNVAWVVIGTQPRCMCMCAVSSLCPFFFFVRRLHCTQRCPYFRL